MRSSAGGFCAFVRDAGELREKLQKKLQEKLRGKVAGKATGKAARKTEGETTGKITGKLRVVRRTAHPKKFFLTFRTFVLN